MSEDTITAAVTAKEDSDDSQLLRHFNRNAFGHYMDGIFFIGGINFVSLNSILPVFIERLTDSSVYVGLLSTIAVLGFSLPQLLSANEASRYQRRRDLVLRKFAWAQRLPWLLLVLNALFVIPSSPRIGLAIFLLVYTGYTVACGLTIPVWFDVMVKSLPVNKRGRVLSVRYVLSGAASVLAGLAAGYILRTMEYPKGYALLFGLTFLATMASLPFFAMIWEPKSQVTNEKRSMGEYLGQLPSLLRRDSNFVSYLIANAFIGLGSMAGSFYTVYALGVLELGPAASGLFASVILASQTLSNFIWGVMADKRSYKLVLEISLGLSCIASLSAILASNYAGFIFVLVLFGAATGGSLFAGMNTVAELCTADDRTTYVSLAGTLSAPIAGLSPLLGGVIAAMVGYKSVFILSLCATLIGMGLLVSRVCTRPLIHAKP